MVECCSMSASRCKTSAGLCILAYLLARIMSRAFGEVHHFRMRGVPRSMIDCKGRSKLRSKPSPCAKRLRRVSQVRGSEHTHSSLARVTAVHLSLEASDKARHDASEHTGIQL